MTPSGKEKDEGIVTKIPTGITGFDLITGGGLPEGRTTLISGTAGSAKTTFALQYLVNGAVTYGEAGVFVTFEETPGDVARNVKGFGWDLRALKEQGRLAFVDVSPAPGEPLIETGNYDFQALLTRIEYAVKKVKARRVAVDSLSTLFSQFGNAAIVRRELFRIGAALKEMGVTTLITAERTREYGDIARYGVEEFVADNVVILRNILENERRRRTVEVLKYRGTPHEKGEFPFTISPRGVEIFPLSAIALRSSATPGRISSGIAALDQMCGGGFFSDSIVLVSGATGAGKTVLLTSFLSESCREGKRSLLFCFEESREQVLRNSRAWGLDLESWEKQGLLRILSAIPESAGLEDHLLVMRRELDDFAPARVGIDSISALERIASGVDFREFAIALTLKIKEQGAAALLTASTAAVMGGNSTTEAHISALTDAIVLMRYVELMGDMRRGITVLKMRGSAHEKVIREYRIDDGGLHIGDAFRNVGGILAGAPTQVLLGESQRLGGMFEE